MILSSDLYVILSAGSMSSIIVLILWTAIFLGTRIALSKRHVVLIYFVRKFGKTLKINSSSVFTAHPTDRKILPF